MNQSRRSLSVVILLSFVLSFVLNVSVVQAATREPIKGQRGMVTSEQVLASEVGVGILKKGGNAVDAAIAVELALAVVLPAAGNLGGCGFMVIRRKDGSTTAIDYREMASRSASRDMYLDKHGRLIEGEGSSLVGYRASGVPGTLAGLNLAFEKYGSRKLKWSDLVEPARLLAKNGFVLEDWQADEFRSSEVLAAYAESKRIFQRNGKYYEKGELLKQPELAQTLGRIARLGAAEFYTGVTAKMIADDMKAHGGLITLEDLKNYKAVERKPVIGSYRGNEIITMPPPSSGGVVLLQILNILEGYDIRSMGHSSAGKYQVLTEAMRRAFADRAEFMGDPDFVVVPVSTLIDKKYAEQRRSSIDKVKATPSSVIGHGKIAVTESMHTTHFTVVDAEGNAVANTTTLNNGYGSGVTIKGAGFLMNNEMDDFAARPGKPNGFGLIQGERNAIQPGKRPLSSMTPTIVGRKDGSLWFALGAQGGPIIISAVTQAVINVIDHDMDIQAAIDAPRIHHQWMPDVLFTEPYGMSSDTRKILEAYGQIFAERPFEMAAATGIMVGEKRIRYGAADSRTFGAAVGY